MRGLDFGREAAKTASTAVAAADEQDKRRKEEEDERKGGGGGWDGDIEGKVDLLKCTSILTFMCMYVLLQ